MLSMDNRGYYLCHVPSELGHFSLVASETALTLLFFDGEAPRFETTEHETPLLREAASQLRQYLSGERQQFTLPLDPIGSDFFRRAWQALVAIPYGETRSYGQIAAAIGNAKACRAVGLANNRNPLPIFIPCHRVIGSNQKLTGYRGGLPLKQLLLELEQRHVRI
jgi:methylated-DNA-[protein]-cysteine S-methyltransferase